MNSIFYRIIKNYKFHMEVQKNPQLSKLSKAVIGRKNSADGIRVTWFPIILELY